MRLKVVIVTLIIMNFLITNVSANDSDYSSVIIPIDNGNTIISWNIIDSPEVPFDWGWTDEGAWLVEPGGKMNFTVTEVGDDYVTGQFAIGNFSIEANNTDIAREIVFSVWGATPFFSGLVVKIGEENLDALNETAHAAAARVSGNYMNGTMESSYGSISTNGHSYNCIIFEYEQDYSGFGEPQVTYLAYDTETGVLVKGNSSYSFGVPYSLVVELESIITPGLDTIWILVGCITAIGIIVIVILIIIKQR